MKKEIERRKREEREAYEHGHAKVQLQHTAGCAAPLVTAWRATVGCKRETPCPPQLALLISCSTCAKDDGNDTAPPEPPCGGSGDGGGGSWGGNPGGARGGRGGQGGE